VIVNTAIMENAGTKSRALTRPSPIPRITNRRVNLQSGWFSRAGDPGCGWTIGRPALQCSPLAPSPASDLFHL
jgi:hypothetical protein